MILLHSIQKGDLPKGFEASVLRTVHSVGQQSNTSVAAVQAKYFKLHPDFKSEPATLVHVKPKAEHKPFDVLNSDLGVDFCVSMKKDGILASIPYTEVTVFHNGEPIHRVPVGAKDTRDAPAGAWHIKTNSCLGWEGERTGPQAPRPLHAALFQ